MPLSRKYYQCIGHAAALCTILFCGPDTRGSEKMLVSSFSQNRIQRISATTGTLIDSLTAGNSIVNPLGFTHGPDGHLYVASEGSDRVLRLRRDNGALIDVFVGDDPATGGIDESGGLDNPAAVVFGPDGKLYVSSFETDAVLRYDGATGAFLDVFVAPGSGGLDGPDAGMVFGPGGDLFVPSFWSDEVLRYSGADGTFLGAFVSAGSGGLLRPRTLLFRPGDGHLLVTSEGADAVLLYDGVSGAPLGALITPIDGPSGMDFGPDGNLYVTSIGANVVRRFQPDGTPLGTFGPVVSLPTYLAFADDGAPDFTSQAQFGNSLTICVAWADIDNDGDLDLAVGNTNGVPNELYINNGGTFVRRAEFGNGSTFAIVFGDYDNDGDADAAVGNSFGEQNFLYENDGSGTFNGRAEFGTGVTVAMAWGDFDGDGDLDLAVGNGILADADQNELWVNEGDGTFTRREEFGIGKTDSVAWGDFDNDGDLDLAVGNGGFSAPAQNYLYVNNGDETFTGREEFGTGDTASVAWGDADNDGCLDLAVGNWENSVNYLYHNDCNGEFTRVLAFGNRDTNTITWGDYDNDGDLDVAAGNGDFSSADQNFLYSNQGDGTFVELPAFGLGSTDGLAFGDFDGDGDLDMAVGNEHTPPQNNLYVNHENDSDYLILKLIGHRHDLGSGYSNRDAVGARVSVYTAGHLCDPAHLLGHRQIEAVGGFTCQGSVEAEFGVPGQSTVDVRIEWPGSDGQRIVQELLAVSVAQYLTIDEAVTIPAADCNGNNVLDVCDVFTGQSTDCNQNSIPDDCDIADLTSEDCTGNGIPDECEPDCNNNAVPDSCDVLNGTSQDCAGDEVPDECEPDCNNNAAADSCDILNEISEDCSANGVPDECEPDCNDTLTADSCDIFNGASEDCNHNDVPDECDLSDGTSDDMNNNGIPDECDECPTLFAPTTPAPLTGKNRYLSIVPGNPGVMAAIRVRYVDMPAGFEDLEGRTMWVGTPQAVSENAGTVNPAGQPGAPTFMAATLQCAPFYADWGPIGVVQAYHRSLLPGGTYEIRVIEETCPTSGESNYSLPLSVDSSRWGDVVKDCQANPCTPPEGVVGIVDVVAILDKFRNAVGAPMKVRADLHPETPDRLITISDVTSALDAFRAAAYPFTPGPDPCAP